MNGVSSRLAVAKRRWSSTRPSYDLHGGWSAQRTRRIASRAGLRLLREVLEQAVAHVAAEVTTDLDGGLRHTLPPYRDGTVLRPWGLAGRRGEINIHGMNTVVWDRTEQGPVNAHRVGTAGAVGNCDRVGNWLSPGASKSKFGRQRAAFGGCGARDGRARLLTPWGAPYPPLYVLFPGIDRDGRDTDVAESAREAVPP